MTNYDEMSLEELGNFHGHPMFYQLTIDEMQLHSDKNRDYTQGGDPLGNFNRVSEIKRLYPNLDWGSPVGVCLGYMLKQFDAALWMLANRYEGEVEDVDTRLRDSHVYLKIARILHKEQSEKSG